jgi:hypothetical protein
MTTEIEYLRAHRTGSLARMPFIKDGRLSGFSSLRFTDAGLDPVLESDVGVVFARCTEFAASRQIRRRQAGSAPPTAFPHISGGSSIKVLRFKILWSKSVPDGRLSA